MVDNSHFTSVRPSFEHFTNIFTYMSIRKDSWEDSSRDPSLL